MAAEMSALHIYHNQDKERERERDLFDAALIRPEA